MCIMLLFDYIKTVGASSPMLPINRSQDYETPGHTKLPRLNGFHRGQMANKQVGV